MKFDPHVYPNASRRVVVYAANGMVATSQTLAAQAGLRVMQQGGNAIDAAIATAAALAVTEPVSNGLGADNFAIVWTGGKLYGLNSSGPAPQALTVETLEKQGHRQMPRYGWGSVTVPGAPAGWAAMSKRFGRLPLSQVLAPAIAYATEGYPIAPYLHRYWTQHVQTYRREVSGLEHDHFFQTWCPNGRIPEVGELFRLPEHARTLQRIGETDAREMYEGEIADVIDQFSRQYGGYIRKRDLEMYQPEWVDPVSINYRGYDVWELPPNSQGIVALMALNMLKDMDLGDRLSVESYHYQMEAMKLSFVDGMKYITDPTKMTVSVRDLLSDAYAQERRRLIRDRAILPEPGHPVHSDTVYLCAADGEGNMVSFIQSNAASFGSGIIVPGTGINFQNRGSSFSLDPAHANYLEPGKRPYHTIVPAFLTKDGTAVGPFGMMGGYMQPQGHAQIIVNTIDYGLNPQSVLDLPRWKWIEGQAIEVEQGFPEHLITGLMKRGHKISVNLDTEVFGKGQIIWKSENNVLTGGTEPRSDGGIAAW